MKQEELNKVCESAENMLKAIQKTIYSRNTILTDTCIKDMVELFRTQINKKCKISD